METGTKEESWGGDYSTEAKYGLEESDKPSTTRSEMSRTQAEPKKIPHKAKFGGG